VVGSSFKGNGKDVKLISDDFYFILERRLSKSKNDDGSEVWLAIDEEALQSRLKSSQHGREALLQHHRFVLKFTRNRPDLLIFHDNEFHLLETIQYRLPYSKSLPLVRGVVAADTCFTPDIDAQTGERDESDIIPNKAFIVLRYIAGDTFTDLSKTWSQSDRFDKTHASLASLEQAFDELSRADIVHRDISPNNLMQDRHGGVHIIDFGFAADLQAETPTKLGEGTIKYRAPEIIEEAQADTRTDQFSLACVFYFLLTGRSPSHGPSGELIDEFNENLPSTLAEVLTQAISENKNERYTDFASFFSALKQAFKQDIQARDELRPLQLNIDGWFEYQTGIQQTIKDYQQLQQSLLAPNTQLQVLKAAGLIGQDKLNILLSYEGIDVNIEKHIKTLQGQDSTADKHLKALKHTLNQLKQGESAAVPSLTNPPKVKQSDYLKLKSQVDDEVEAFNDLLAGIGEQMIGQVEQHSQWPDEALNGEINIVEHIISELNQQKNTFTKQFSKAKKANEKQNHVLSQLNQFISELNQGALQSKNKLTPINDGLLTNKAHLIASITERLESEQRIKALISEYQQFIEQCQTFNQTGKQAAEQLRLLNNNQKSTQGYWQKQWNEASESKVLSTNLLLILLVSIIAGVVYWSPFKQENNKISLVKHTPGIVQLKLDEALQEGRYQLSTKDSAVACKYNAYRSRALSNNQVEGETYFICRGLIAGEHQYTLGSPTKGIIKTGIISITPPVHKFAITTKPVEAIATLETSHKDIKYQEQFKAGEDVPEGKYQLKITAKDYHDKVEAIEWRGQPLSIELETIDTEPPTIKLTNIKQDGETLSLTINSKDNKGLRQLSVKVIQDEKEVEGSAKIWLLDHQTETSINWLYSVGDLEEGAYKAGLKLEDVNGNIQKLTHYFSVDFYKIAVQFYEGKGVKKDYDKAIAYFQLASKTGNADAQFSLCWIYQKDEGVKPDDKNSFKWCLKSAEQGNSNAQYYLGYMYENGIGVVQDYKSALGWYRKAEKQGDGNALIKAVSIEAKLSKKKTQISSTVEVKPIKDKTYTVGNASFTMKAIPAGSFMMGCVNGKECKDNELPVHKVTLEAFHMMETEVTWNLYEKCIEDKACVELRTGFASSLYNNSHGNYPVNFVSFENVVNEFIPWLNKKTNAQFFLPSEGQWEYAARAGTKTKYTWGNEIDCNKAQYDGPIGSSCNIPFQGQRKTSLVKSFSQNDYGLYDIHGNVAELTEDCFNDSYKEAPVSSEPWKSGDCTKNIVRGGSLIDSAAILYTRRRDYIDKSWNTVGTGFRLVQNMKLEINPTQKKENSSKLISGRYIDNKDGTVTDTKTNLQWMRCAIGEEWDGESCIGTPPRYSFEDALILAKSYEYGGVNGWRLPTPMELGTLVKCSYARHGGYYYWLSEEYSEIKYFYRCEHAHGAVISAIDLTAFPNTAKKAFWTSKQTTYNEDMIHAVGFHDGALTNVAKDKMLRLRFLRSIDKEKSSDIRYDSVGASSVIEPIKDKTYTLGNTKFKMKAIPAGAFYMGCNDSVNCDKSELPYHKVTLDEFYMMDTEVTFELWNACAKSGDCYHRTIQANETVKHPINVTFKDVESYFLPWINKVTGKEFKLPSEAQWEYAARAGTTTKYSFGDHITCSDARYNGGKGSKCFNPIRNANYESEYSRIITKEVASFRANDFGLYDMHGNVWEFTQDCWSRNYSEVRTYMKSDSDNPFCIFGWRATRGGGGASSADRLRSSIRGHQKEYHFGLELTGFRLIEEIPVKKNRYAINNQP